ncbi:MAG: flagellar protein FlaG [Acidobacteria bacterium]|nr:flagellar protein FlaG [Acidobacteriota bacterium]MCB9396174.1 flagellar protein FlaG [Acidobacteriota bacterium]
MLTRAIQSSESTAYSVLERTSSSAGRVGSEKNAARSEETKLNVVNPELGNPGLKALPAAEEPVPETSTSTNQQNLEQLATQVNRQTDQSINVRFRKDEETGLDFFQIVDKKSGEVLRQYPPEEFLNLVKNLQDVSGLIFSDEV